MSGHAVAEVVGEFVVGGLATQPLLEPVVLVGDALGVRQQVGDLAVVAVAVAPHSA